MTYNKKNNPLMYLKNSQVDPLTGQPIPTTMVPPQLTPTGGSFAPQVQQDIQNIAGTPEMRQYGAAGMNAPLFFKDQNGDGKITRADVIKARTEGYKK
jgi:hypothetical protein